MVDVSSHLSVGVNIPCLLPNCDKPFHVNILRIISMRDMCIAVTQSEIEGLYRRFRALDRGRKVCTDYPSDCNDIHSRAVQDLNVSYVPDFLC